MVKLQSLERFTNLQFTCFHKTSVMRKILKEGDKTNLESINPLLMTFTTLLIRDKIRFYSRKIFDSWTNISNETPVAELDRRRLPRAVVVVEPRTPVRVLGRALKRFPRLDVLILVWQVRRVVALSSYWGLGHRVYPATTIHLQMSLIGRATSPKISSVC